MAREWPVRRDSPAGEAPLPVIGDGARHIRRRGVAIGIGNRRARHETGDFGRDRGG